MMLFLNNREILLLICISSMLGLTLLFFAFGLCIAANKTTQAHERLLEETKK